MLRISWNTVQQAQQRHHDAELRSQDTARMLHSSRQGIRDNAAQLSPTLRMHHMVTHAAVTIFHNEQETTLYSLAEVLEKRLVEEHERTLEQNIPVSQDDMLALQHAVTTLTMLTEQRNSTLPHATHPFKSENQDAKMLRLGVVHILGWFADNRQLYTMLHQLGAIYTEVDTEQLLRQDAIDVLSGHVVASYADIADSMEENTLPYEWKQPLVLTWVQEALLNREVLQQRYNTMVYTSRKYSVFVDDEEET